MENDNVVWRFLNKMTDLFLLNLLFVICSLPVVTIGASLAAMYTVNLRSVRYGDGYVVKGFFRGFRQCFKQATAAWLLFLLCGGILFIDYRFWQQVGGSTANIMQMVSIAIAMLLLILFLWLFPVIAKMQDPFFSQIKNAAAMAVGYFVPHTVLCLFLTLGFGYVAYTNIAAMMILLVIGFAVITYVQSFFFYQVFAKFITETPASDDDLLYTDRENEEERENGQETEIMDEK